MECECGRAALLLCLVLASIIAAEAKSLLDISPSLEPESSKKFFGKDYPSDERPGVDVLHFNHPYPVIQDNSEFDRDFVKDENGDNGHWLAQQEYDRLRHKLKQEKKEAAKALAKRRVEEDELGHAVKKYEQEVNDNKKKLEAAQRKEAEKKAKENEGVADAKDKNEKGWSWSWDWWPFSWPAWKRSKSEPAPQAVEKSSDFERATEATEKSMDNLEDCKKELARAQAELEKVMDEMKKAKGKQSEADAAVDRLAERQFEAEKLANGLHDEYSDKESEHAKADAAYQKQKQIVDKMKVDLEAAKSKVSAYRDAEDKGGGVYNTRTRSLTISISSPNVGILVLMVATALRLA